MIHIETQPADNPLTGQSKWWGEPDMPVGFDWPAMRVTDGEGETYDDPLTFVCQIRCDDISPMDSAICCHMRVCYTSLQPSIISWVTSKLLPIRVWVNGKGIISVCCTRRRATTCTPIMSTIPTVHRRRCLLRLYPFQRAMHPTMA